MKRQYIILITFCLISALLLTTGCPKNQTETCIQSIRNQLANRHYKNIYYRFDRNIKKQIDKEMDDLYQQKTIQRRLIIEYGARLSVFHMHGNSKDFYTFPNGRGIRLRYWVSLLLIHYYLLRKIKIYLLRHLPEIIRYTLDITLEKL